MVEIQLQKNSRLIDLELPRKHLSVMSFGLTQESGNAVVLTPIFKELSFARPLTKKSICARFSFDRAHANQGSGYFQVL